MTKIAMTTDQPVGPTAITGPTAAPQTAPLGRLDTTQVHPTIGASIDGVREEVDDAFKDMETFYQREPDEITRMASGHSARLSYLRVLIFRVEDWAREWKPVRERELEPALAELEKQYTMASRLHSYRELDWKMESGER